MNVFFYHFSRKSLDESKNPDLTKSKDIEIDENEVTLCDFFCKFDYYRAKLRLKSRKSQKNSMNARISS